LRLKNKRLDSTPLGLNQYSLVPGRHHDSRSWTLQAKVAPSATPQIAKRGAEGFRLGCAVELELDHDVVRVVGRAQNPITPHASSLPADWIAVERLLRGVVVPHSMFDLQDWHF
jgi:hypothetical protein